MADEVDINDGEEQSPNWVRPTLYQPKRGSVLPGFWVEANIDVLSPSKWQLKIMEGGNQLYFVEESAGRWFSHYVKDDAIRAGSKFTIHVHYFIWPAWSEWASVDGYVMEVPKPEITEPLEGAQTGPWPRVAGRGIPGAKVELYQAGSGTVLFGTAVVDVDGNWATTPVERFFEGPFGLTVNQTFKNMVSKYSDTRTFTVAKSTVSPPKIDVPKGGSVVGINKPMVLGQGLPGATIKLYQANVGNTVFGTGVVPPSGIWAIYPTIAFPKGAFSLTANQTSLDVTSDWAEDVTFTVPV